MLTILLMLIKKLYLIGFTSYLCSPVFAQNENDIGEDEISEFLELKHSSEGIMDEMKIFPDIRELHATQNVTFPEGVPKDEKKLIVKSKFVHGIYYVTECTVGDEEQFFNLVSITCYFVDKKTYYRWVYNKQKDETTLFLGTRIQDQNTISWAMLHPEKHGVDLSIISEQYHPDKIEWTARTFESGEVIFAYSGSAVRAPDIEKAKKEKAEDAENKLE